MRLVRQANFAVQGFKTSISKHLSAKKGHTFGIFPRTQQFQSFLDYIVTSDDYFSDSFFTLKRNKYRCKLN